MSELKPQWRGLIVQLAGFFLVLALPVLLLVESTLMYFEYREFLDGVDRGEMAEEVERESRALGREWQEGYHASPLALQRDLESWLLRLERPHGALGEAHSMILLELSAQPFSAMVINAEGRVLAIAPHEPEWHTAAIESPVFIDDRAVLIDTIDGTESMRKFAAPIYSPQRERIGTLVLELRINAPWRKLMVDLSFEWPVLLAYLVIFAVGSALFVGWYVTRRLNRIAAAASAWRRGDFTQVIGDTSGDELGRLSRLLDRMADDLKELMRARTELASVNERQRLARDLHDTVKQKAFALNLQLATASALMQSSSASPATERLAEAQRLTTEIQRELALTLDDLRDDRQPRMDFALALRSRVDDWARMAHVRTHVDIATNDDVFQPARDELLRIVDEALANVLRHSGATEVRIRFARESQRLVLRIGDDGHGVPAAASEGMGLGNMRSRAQSLRDGDFHIDSAPGTGVTITVSFRQDPETFA